MYYLGNCPEVSVIFFFSGSFFFVEYFAVSLQDQITITGYEHKAIAARDAIQAIVDELEEMVSEDVNLDSRVHARIIGARGKGIRKIMDEFKVRIWWQIFLIGAMKRYLLAVYFTYFTLEDKVEWWAWGKEDMRDM